MNVASNRVSINLSEQRMPIRVSVMQGDTARRLEYLLYTSSYQWKPDNATPYIAFTRPNGENIKLSSKDIDGIVSVHGEFITVHLPREATIVSGEIPFVLGFEDSSGSSLAAFPILLDVIANPAFNSEGLTIANLDKSLDEIIDIQEKLIGGESK